ncbi:HOPM interactor 7 [Striga asiatica]|uniref:HOPM interactor 7 n=1 Tax=Striga asiatica TaxID=4170 RepID=A0A5A7NX51_STRAF|nr:HOPM interactor 7 [Striga asiatica]
MELLSINSGVSNCRTVSLVSSINLTTLGNILPRPVLVISGIKTPSLYRVSMAVKWGKPRLLSTMEVFTDGMSIWSTEYMVFAESWAASSAAARVRMVGAAEDGACQVIVGVGISEIVVDIVVVNPLEGLALTLAVAT